METNKKNKELEIRFAGKVYKVHGVREFPGGINGYIIEDEPGHYDCIINPDEVLGCGYGIAVKKQEQPEVVVRKNRITSYPKCKEG